MGFFDDVQHNINNVVNPVKNTVRSIGETSRAAMGSLGYLNPITAGSQLASDYFNQEDKKKAAEEEEAAARERLNQSVGQLDQLRAQQGLFAAGLKKNALRDYGLLTEQASANERRAMAEKLRGTKEAANSRGLLGSGIQKSGEAGARAEASANTAAKQKQIQDLLSEQINDAELLQAQLGLEMGGISQNMSDQYYRMAIENMNKRNQSYADILGAAGRVGGSYLGSRGS